MSVMPHSSLFCLSVFEPAGLDDPFPVRMTFNFATFTFATGTVMDVPYDFTGGHGIWRRSAWASSLPDASIRTAPLARCGTSDGELRKKIGPKVSIMPFYGPHGGQVHVIPHRQPVELGHHPRGRSGDLSYALSGHGTSRDVGQAISSTQCSCSMPISATAHGWKSIAPATRHGGRAGKYSSMSVRIKASPDNKLRRGIGSFSTAR